MGDGDERGTQVGRRRRRVVAALLALTVAVGGTACGDDSSDDEGSSTTAAVTGDGADAAAEPGVTEPGDVEPGDVEDAGGGSAGADTEVTSEEICAAVTPEAVAEASGLEITGAEPSEGSTPQCAYSYPSENGPDSTLTVAASRYTDSDAASIEEAFDGAVQVNVTTAGGPEAEQTEVAAGDEAVLISGPALDLGVLRVGNVLASLIVPPGAVTAAQTEALMVAIGDAFA